MIEHELNLSNLVRGDWVEVCVGSGLKTLIHEGRFFDMTEYQDSWLILIEKGDDAANFVRTSLLLKDVIYITTKVNLSLTVKTAAERYAELGEKLECSPTESTEVDVDENSVKPSISAAEAEVAARKLAEQLVRSIQKDQENPLVYQ